MLSASLPEAGAEGGAREGSWWRVAVARGCPMAAVVAAAAAREPPIEAAGSGVPSKLVGGHRGNIVSSASSRFREEATWTTRRASREICGRRRPACSCPKEFLPKFYGWRNREGFVRRGERRRRPCRFFLRLAVTSPRGCAS